MDICSQFHVQLAFISRQATPTEGTVTRQFAALAKIEPRYSRPRHTWLLTELP